MIELITAQELSKGLRITLSFFIPLLFCLIFGKTIIRYLIALKVGQPIRSAEEVHKLAELHGEKAGTPTMGGVMILGGSILGALLMGQMDNIYLWLCIGSTLILSLLGLADDYLKVKYKNSAGISGKVKLLVQAIVGAGAGCILYFHCGTSEVFIPIYGNYDLSPWLFIPFTMLTLMACSNAVNLTDGLDGLAAGCTVPTGLAYAIIAAGAGFVIPASFINPGSAEVAIFLVALVGGCVGFLWFNCNPAQVFMGDTGSLAIGGGLGMAAICLKQELLFIVVGAVFFLEALSVVLQVVYYKATKYQDPATGQWIGKRLFKMTPIHHHFELSGWKETKVFQRFWILALIAAVVGFTLIALS